MTPRAHSLVVLLLFAAASAAFAVPGCAKSEDEPESERVAASAAPRFSPPPARPAPRPREELSPDEQATVEKVMEARDEMARIAEAHANDCDKAARGIEAVVVRSRPLLAASAELESDPAKRRWIGEKHGARMLASSSKLMALMESCDRHEGLTRIFESLD
jgi:hypothetical protein